MKVDSHIQKLCCFYASDWHLTVMLLPYIDKKIKENNSIFMRCENSIEDKMNILIDKLRLKDKAKILNMNWNNMVAEESEDFKNKIFIVSGDEDYIKETNKNIEGYYSKSESKCNIKIVNCYEITNNNINTIIEENGYNIILNTKGENFINKKLINF